MKKNIGRIFAIFSLSAAVLVACTEEEQTPEPNFPETMEDIWLDFDNGQPSYILTVSPNQNWTVSIPSTAAAYWAIRSGSQNVMSVSGSAGEQKIEIVCLASEQDLSDHSVDVSLTMGGQTQVIATITLRAGDAVFNVFPVSIVDDEDGEHRTFAAAAAGASYNYSYDDEPLASDSSLEMLWDASRNRYVSYILVESNFNWAPVELNGLRMTAMENSNTDARFRELEIVCSEVNYPAEEDKPYTIGLESSTKGFEKLSINVSVPPFSPVLEIRPAVPNTDGDDFQQPSTPEDDETAEESPYQWVFGDPLEDNGTVSMIWRPATSVSVVDSYILVRANFTFSIVSDLSGLAVSEPSVIEETTTAYETEAIYHLSVSSSDLNPAGESSGFSIGVGGFKKTCTLETPDVSGYFYISNSPTFEFNGDGKYTPSSTTATSGSDAVVEITSADRTEDIQILTFAFAAGSYTETGNEWVSGTWPASPNKEGALVTNTLTVKAGSNESGELRRGLIMAFPKDFALPSDHSEMFDSQGNVADDYLRYVVAYLQQSAKTVKTGVLSAVDADMWQYEMAKFEILDSDPSGNNIADCYRITYAAAVNSANEVLNSEGYLQISVAAGTRVADWRAVDTKGQSVDIDASDSWLKVKEYGSGQYFITMKPYGIETPELYVILVGNNNNDLAVIDCCYDPDAIISDIELSIAPGYEDGVTLTQLSGNDELVSGQQAGSFWLLEYSGTERKEVVIQGIPLDIRTAIASPATSDWLESSYRINGSCTITFTDPELPGPKDMAMVYFYASTSGLEGGGASMLILCRVTSPDTGEGTETGQR